MTDVKLSRFNFITA